MNIINWIINIYSILFEIQEFYQKFLSFQHTNSLINIICVLIYTIIMIIQGIIKTLIDGIAFISNMENEMMGNQYYIMDNIKKEENFKIKGNENFKILINNYILKDYNIYNYNRIYTKNRIEMEIINIIKFLFLNLENLLIGSQKWLYEYINYFKHLYDWYYNFKILIDKSIINCNIKEELNYNISLELLSDIQDSHNKVLWWFLKLNKEEYGKHDLKFLIHKKYFKKFQIEPNALKIALQYKINPKKIVYPYGLKHDINIYTHNKYNLNVNILSTKNDFINSDTIIKNYNREIYSILNRNYNQTNENIILKDSYFKNNLKENIPWEAQNKEFNKYLEKFVNTKFNSSQNFIKRTYNSIRLHLFNNRFFSFNFLRNSILVYPWDKFNWRLDIPYFVEFDYKDDKDLHYDWEHFPWGWMRFKIKENSWRYINLNQPDRVIRFIKYIARFFIGLEESQIISPSWASNFISGKKYIFNIKDINKDIDKTLSEFHTNNVVADEREGIMNLYRLRKIYGGYSYWWAWHQDALFLEKEKYKTIASPKIKHKFEGKLLLHPKFKYDNNVIKPNYPKKPVYRGISIIPYDMPVWADVLNPEVKIPKKISDEFYMNLKFTQLRDALTNWRTTGTEIEARIEDMRETENWRHSRKNWRRALSIMRNHWSFKLKRGFLKIMAENKRIQEIKEFEPLGDEDILPKSLLKDLKKKVTKVEKIKAEKIKAEKIKVEKIKVKKVKKEPGIIDIDEEKIKLKKQKKAELIEEKKRRNYGKWLRIQELKRKKEIERIAEVRRKRDPWHISRKLKIPPRMWYEAYKLPDIQKMNKEKKDRGIMDKIFIKVKTPKKLIIKNSLIPEKGWKKSLVSKMFRVPKKALRGNWYDYHIKRGQMADKYRRKFLVLHGNIGLKVSKNFFKNYLVANDIWAKFSLLEKKNLLKKFKTYRITKKLENNITKVELKTPHLVKRLGKFVSLDDADKQNTLYKNFMKKERENMLYRLKEKNFVLNLLYLDLRDSKGWDEWIKFIKEGSIYNKNWIQMAKNKHDIFGTDYIEAIDKAIKAKKDNYYKNMEEFKFKSKRKNDLLQMKIGYNTPVKMKKIVTDWKKKVAIRKNKLNPLSVNYYMPYKWFERNFYPEFYDKLKIIKRKKHANLMFELKMPWKVWKKRVISGTAMFDHDLKIKYKLYKNAVTSKFKLKYLKVKEMGTISEKSMRGFLMIKYIWRTFAIPNYLSILDYLRKTSITSDNIYHINIEGVTDSLNLNLIYKNFYGKNFNKGFNAILYKKYDLINNVILPRNKDILLKKTYLINLLNIYEKEDKPILNYIWFILKKEDFKVIHKSIIIILEYLYNVIINTIDVLWDMYKGFFKFFLELIGQELMSRFREVRRLVRFIEQHPELKKYIIIYTIISIIFFLYVIISIFLVLIIKAFLPKNLIYGKKIKNETLVKNDYMNEKIENISIRNNNIENSIKEIYELENILNINLKKKDREQLHKDIIRELKREANNGKINEITVEALKKLELYIILKNKNKLKIKKNFFDAEQRYIYVWNTKKKYILEELREANDLKKLMDTENISPMKKKYYRSKIYEKQINRVEERYKVFYKTFIFEKNLEKWENNTKRRLEFLFNKQTKGIIRLLLTDIWRAFLDRKYNHNRMLFWEDPDLDDTSKLKHMFIYPKPFANIIFIIRFTLGSLNLWDPFFWINKWRQYVMYGKHERFNYRELKERLEKEWSIEWYKDEVDYGRMLLKDFMKVIKKYNDIKKTSLNKDISDKQILRKDILYNIINLTTEEDKFKQIREYLSYLNNIEADRAEISFEAKFDNIAKKLVTELDKIGPKRWAEQKLRYKYRDKVFEAKLKVEKEEYEKLRESYTSNVKRDTKDKGKSLKLLQWTDEKKVQTIMKQKIATLEYERNIREYNYHNKFIDAALDEKEKPYYEAIREYNEELSDEYVRIKKEQADERMKENTNEKKAKKLYGLLDENFIWFRSFTTMGARFNYIFVIIASIFAAWWDNMKQIRKSEVNLINLLKIMKTDFVKYIYKIYWEYLILENKNKALKNRGLNIKEILKFCIILTPIFIYFTFLYSIFILYFILIIILFIIPKKKYYKIKDKIMRKITGIRSINNIRRIRKEILNFFRYLWKIINLLFRDVDTGETLWTRLYKIFYTICGKLQYNFYMCKGAFMLGYKYNNENKIKNGLISVKKWLKLKYDCYKENWKDKNKNFFSKKNWKIRTIKMKENTQLKIRLLKIVMPIRPYILKKRGEIWRFMYIQIGKRIFKLSIEEFTKIYNENTELFRVYYNKIMDLFRLSIAEAKQMKIKDLIILILKTILKTIWSLLILPFVFVRNHQRWKYVKNYKRGIQGFRDNPMSLIIDNPKKRKKHEWKEKLHDILMEQKISRYFGDLLQRTDTIIDIFFIFKIHEVKWANKNYYQDFFWRKWYWKYKKTKEYVVNYLRETFIKIEENYASFEDSIETKNWSLWERAKYAYYTYKMFEHSTTRKIQKKRSRDAFFYNKIKERKKIMRIYFFKGLINWITYISINKVIFTKVHNIKKKKEIYKDKKNYKLNDIKDKFYIKNFIINNNVHITEHLKETPPQLWSLIIMYDIYYKTLLRYRFEDPTYPHHWVEGGLEYQKDYKWRLAAPQHSYDIPFYDRRFMAADINTYDFIEFVGSLANEPYDPLLRWIIFLVDYGMSKEDIIKIGEDVWLDAKEQDNLIWGDISLTHLLTYNKKLDTYRYEIKNFNRLMKELGLHWFKSWIKEDTLERDKLNHYQDRFKEISNDILTQNEDIFKDILKERRLIRAKMLHKALLHNKLKTKYEKDQEDSKEREREFYFTKKKEFFEELYIEDFWDWQADYDEGIVEDKYFNTKDIDNRTYDAHLYEEYFLENRKRLDYTYLINSIVLRSYDQTVEEIYYFLTFKVWEKLKKDLKIEKKQIQINYKNIIISKRYAEKINYDQHIITKTRKKFNRKENIEEWEEYYAYKYNKLEWEPAKDEAIYGFKESNTLSEFNEAGEYYTYEEKIEYNEEALLYARPETIFHGQKLLRSWRRRISTRNETLHNIKKKSMKKKRKIPLNIAYINNIKWTWEQWLVFTDVETENELLNKNMIILNERFNLWNLKRVPVRIKLPIALQTDYEEVQDYIKDKSNYMSFMDHRQTMMLSNIAPILKSGLVWEECKLMLEKRFDKNIQDLILWLFTAELYNREVLKIKEDYKFVLKNFERNYAVFHKLYFLGMAQYTWDLIRYHEAWWGRDEFPYEKYFQLKQIEFLNHDPAAKKITGFLYKLYLDKFVPASFVFFFKNQYYPYYYYHIYGILSISSLIWAFKVLMYNPGEYLSENFMLFIPMFFTLFFWYLRRNLKNIKDLKDGAELYLYKYHWSTVLTDTERLHRKLGLEQKKQEWTYHFYDADKIPELFPEGIKSFNTNLMPNWWRYYTHRNKYSEIYQYASHGIFWCKLFVIYFACAYWNVYKFRHRNLWWLWDYYQVDEKFVAELRAKGLISADVRAPKNFKERQWYYDSWHRLENGGNWYTRWYENTYRKLWRLPEKELDYGFAWQKIYNVDAAMLIDGKVYRWVGSVSDINWIFFSRHVEGFNLLPDNYKDVSKQLSVDYWREFENLAKRRLGKKIKKKIKKRLRKKKEPETHGYLVRKKKRRTKLEKMEQRWENFKAREKKSFYKKYFDERMKYQHPSAEKEISNLEELKIFLREVKAELKENFRRVYKGKRYIVKDHPLGKWVELLYWLEDRGYYATKNIFGRFIIDSMKKTRIMFTKDVKRYVYKHKIVDQEIQELEDFYQKYLNIKKNLNIYINAQEKKRSKEILLMKSRAFYKGEKMDIRSLASMTDKEIEVGALRFFMYKYKQIRILEKLDSLKRYYVGDKNKVKYIKKFRKMKRDAITELKHFFTTYEWSYFDFIKRRVIKYYNPRGKIAKIQYAEFRLRKMKEIELWKALYLKNVKKLKKYCNYLNDLPKRVSAVAKAEDRYNIMMNFYNERKNLWIFIKDFFYEMSIWDWIVFIVKMIFKAFE